MCILFYQTVVSVLDEIGVKQKKTLPTLGPCPPEAGFLGTMTDRPAGWLLRFLSGLPPGYTGIMGQCGYLNLVV